MRLRLLFGVMLLFGTEITQPILAQQDVPLVPISDMQVDYGEEIPGLYGSAGNTIPQFYRPLVQYAADGIEPLDADGNPDTDGLIGFLSVGMSNTSQEFSAFMQLANEQGQVNPAIILVDGAQGGVDSVAWNTQETPWNVLNDRLSEAGVTPAQIQVIWLEIEVHSITQYASDDDSQKRYRVEQMEQIINRLSGTFPHLQIIYLSARAYGGFYNAAVASNLSVPEPRSYEHGFAVRQVILNAIRQDQASLDSETDFEPLLPVVIWGPYFWAAESAREDGLFYVREDYARDGIHPGSQGQRKIGTFMLNFFVDDPTTQSWFPDNE